VLFTLERGALLQELLVHIIPVAQATLHDSLDECQFLGSRPIFDKEREVKVVVDKEVVRLLVVAFGLVLGALSQTLQAEEGILVGWAVEAADLDSLLDVSFTDRACLWPLQLVQCVQSGQKFVVTFPEARSGLLREQIFNEWLF